MDVAWSLRVLLCFMSDDVLSKALMIYPGCHGQDASFPLGVLLPY